MARTGSTFALRGARVFDGDEIRDDLTVNIADGEIAGVQSNAPAGAAVRHLAGGLLVPGFVDLQVNGGGGVLLNNDPSPEGLERIVAGHRARGTTALLPTVISDSIDIQREAASTISDAIATGNTAVLGIHLEGPHLDAGKRGVHREVFFRPLDEAEQAWLGGLAERLTVLVTLAPEHVAPSVVRRLSDSGIIVCAGHSNASAQAVEAAAANGLAGFTHLYNAMGGFAAREPGVVGAALDLDNCACGIIVDGHHVSAAAVRLAWRAKPAGKLFLVSDAMATVGSTSAAFDLYGEPVEVVDGCLRNREGRLAGSAICLADAVRIAHREVRLPLEDCLRMASLYPAAFVGESHRRGRIGAGYRADLVHLDDELNVREVWVGGVAVAAPR